MLQDNFAQSIDLQQARAKQEAPPKTRAIEPTGTFARAIMVEPPGYVARRTVNCAISLLVHFGTVFVLLALPLFFSADARLATYATPALVTAPLPPPRDPLGFHPHTLFRDENRLFSHVKLTAPMFDTHRLILASAALPPEEPLKPVPLGISGGTGDVLGGILSEVSLPPVEPLAAPNARGVQVGGELKEPRLVSGFTLAYPLLAKVAHVFGRVVIDAIIDETGKVTNVRVVSGPILLTPAAMNAVSHAKFQPVLLDGLPTRCGLTVQVSFRLYD